MLNPFNMSAKSEICILLHREGVLKQLERRLAGLRSIIYGNDVETPLARKCHMPQVIACDSGQCPLLVAIHGRFGWLDIASGARLDLDETQHILVPANEVDFSSVMRRPEISRHHYVSTTAQVKVRIFFASLTGALMLRALVRGKGAFRQPI
jgi:hypothetical protein